MITVGRITQLTESQRVATEKFWGGEPQVCEWNPDYGIEMWIAGCENCLPFVPSYTDYVGDEFKFCPYCGKPITVHP